MGQKGEATRQTAAHTSIFTALFAILTSLDTEPGRLDRLARLCHSRRDSSATTTLTSPLATVTRSISTWGVSRRVHKSQSG